MMSDVRAGCRTLDVVNQMPKLKAQQYPSFEGELTFEDNICLVCTEGIPGLLASCLLEFFVSGQQLTVLV